MANLRKVVVVRNDREVTTRMQDIKKGEKFKVIPAKADDKDVDGKTWYTAASDGYLGDNGGTVEVVK